MGSCLYLSTTFTDYSSCKSLFGLSQVYCSRVHYHLLIKALREGWGLDHLFFRFITTLFPLLILQTYRFSLYASLMKIPPRNGMCGSKLHLHIVYFSICLPRYAEKLLVLVVFFHADCWHSLKKVLDASAENLVCADGLSARMTTFSCTEPHGCDEHKFSLSTTFMEGLPSPFYNQST